MNSMAPLASTRTPPSASRPARMPVSLSRLAPCAGGASVVSKEGSEAALDDARNRLRGAPGTSVAVEFSHPWDKGAVRSADLRRFAVRRKDVEVAALLPSPTAPKIVAYARVAGFSRETAPELLESLAALRYDAASSKLQEIDDCTYSLIASPHHCFSLAVQCKMRLKKYMKER